MPAAVDKQLRGALQANEGLLHARLQRAVEQGQLEPGTNEDSESEAGENAAPGSPPGAADCAIAFARRGVEVEIHITKRSGHARELERPVHACPRLAAEADNNSTQTSAAMA